jgi:hypothetical protein
VGCAAGFVTITVRVTAGVLALVVQPPVPLDEGPLEYARKWIVYVPGARGSTGLTSLVAVVVEPEKLLAATHPDA